MRCRSRQLRVIFDAGLVLLGRSDPEPAWNTIEGPEHLQDGCVDAMPLTADMVGHGAGRVEQANVEVRFWDNGRHPGVAGQRKRS